MCVSCPIKFLGDAYQSHILALAVPTPYPTEPQLLLIPPSKEYRSPHTIDGPSPTNESTSRSSEASLRTQTMTRTETLPNPPTTTPQPHTTSNSNGDTVVGNTSGPSQPPGLITHAYEEDHESQRESTFDAPPPAYQPQRGSAINRLSIPRT